MFSLKREMAARMQSAGGLYNFGGIIDLYSVAASALVMRPPSNLFEAWTSIQSQFLGDGPSLFLSAAALIFFVGGEAYYQAWKNGFPPKRAATFWGDALSGLGAVALGIGLYGIGEPVLAAFSGGLHAFGKFGSALSINKKVEGLLKREFKIAGLITTGGDLLKDIVMASRIPAVSMFCLESCRNFASLPASDAIAKSMMPALLMWCYHEWLKADRLLLQNRSLIKQAGKKLARTADKVITALSFPLWFNKQIPTDASATLSPKQQRRLRRQNFKYLAASSGMWAIIVGNQVASSLLEPAVKMKILPLAIPLVGKAVYMLAKSMANVNRSRHEISDLTRKPRTPEAPRP